MQMNAAQMFNLQQQSQEILQNSQRNARKSFCSALCSVGSQAVSVCVYQKCHKGAFVCQNSNCKCRQQHKMFCSYLPISTLTELIEDKRFYDQEAINKIEQKFDQLIDEISVQRDKVIEGLKIVGLQEIEKYFLNLLDQQQRGILSGNMVSQLLESLDQYDCQGRYCWKKSLVENLDSKIEKVLNTAIQGLVQSLRISKNLSFKRPFEEIVSCRGIMIHSMILKEANQIANLIDFFKSYPIGQSPIKFNLLYRASENDFKMHQFWEKCDGIPQTMVLIKTQYGKIIGGFTPLSWKKHKNQQWQTDDTGQSFVFSISENAKFALKEDKKRYAIRHRINDGLYWGWGQLHISDNSNSTCSSCADIGEYYINPNFEYRSASTKERFIGNPKSSCFKVIEWEVHEVRF